METREEIITEPWHIRESYMQMVKERQERFKRECNQQLIDYIPVITNNNLRECITNYLDKRNRSI
jgi:hypothetical protein